MHYRGVTDCHVAPLLAMTVGEMSPHPSALPLLTPGMFLRTLRAKRSCTRRRVTVFSMSLRASAHTGVAIRFPRRGTWQGGSSLGEFVTPCVFALGAALRYVLLQEKRIATSLRSSQ